MKKNSPKLSLEEQLSLLKEKLKISQSLVKIGFWEINREEENIILSEEAIQILKIDGTKPILSINEFARVIGKDRYKYLQSRFEELNEDFKELDFEFTLQEHIDENPSWIKVIANTAARSKKNPNSIIGIVQDISEQKRSEQQLMQAKEKAEEADILKSAFLANMSHEIRTPLNAIVGFSKLLSNPDIDNKQRNEYSEYITNSANNLLYLIRDIVDVSKIEAGKILIEESVCNVNKILKELKFTFEKEKENQSKSNIEIILSKAVNDENFAIKTDPYRFHQIMVNLIGNALKFIEKGYIEFGYTIENLFLQFYVKDTGIGIPEDKKDLIFSRFGQIINNKIKNPGGTGLGLSITKHLVERLGGRIWVESEAGTGTIFYFTLPFKKLEPQEIKVTHLEDEAYNIDIGKIRILAVEDDQINMILLEDTLNLYIKNCFIEKASNGNEALKKLQSADFDLIIMDVRMPSMDGYEATYHIRNDFPYPKNATPILGLSAHALKEEINKGKQIGMNEFLSKPVTPEELVLKLKILTGKAHSIHFKGIPERKKETSDENELNIEFLEKIFGNETKKINRTLQAYLDQIPDQLNSMQEAVHNKNPDKLKNSAHSLKSTFKYLGRFDLSELAREIEFSSKENNSKDLILANINSLFKEWNVLKSMIIKKINQ